MSAAAAASAPAEMLGDTTPPFELATLAGRWVRSLWWVEACVAVAFETARREPELVRGLPDKATRSLGLLRVRWGETPRCRCWRPVTKRLELREGCCTRGKGAGWMSCREGGVDDVMQRMRHQGIS